MSQPELIPPWQRVRSSPLEVWLEAQINDLPSIVWLMTASNGVEYGQDDGNCRLWNMKDLSKNYCILQ